MGWEESSLDVEVVEDFVGGLSDAYEGGALWKFLEREGSGVGTGGSNAAEDVLDGVVHVTAVWHLDQGIQGGIARTQYGYRRTSSSTQPSSS